MWSVAPLVPLIALKKCHDLSCSSPCLVLSYPVSTTVKMFCWRPGPRWHSQGGGREQWFNSNNAVSTFPQKILGVSRLNGTFARTWNACRSYRIHSLGLCVNQRGHQAPCTELRRSLHWLPIKQRIDYKVAVIAYITRSTGVPSFLSTLTKDYEPGRSFCSSDRLLLRASRAKLVCSRRAFSVNTPIVWNSLSFNCRSAQSLSSFKRVLKTDLFATAYSSPTCLRHRVPGWIASSICRPIGDA